MAQPIPHGPYQAIHKRSGRQFGAFNIYGPGGQAAGSRIAEVPSFNGSHATAHLMAATWDMLHALKAAEDWLVSTGADGAPLTTIRAALAKAGQ